MVERYRKAKTPTEKTKIIDELGMALAEGTRDVAPRRL